MFPSVTAWSAFIPALCDIAHHPNWSTAVLPATADGWHWQPRWSDTNREQFYPRLRDAATRSVRNTT